MRNPRLLSASLAVACGAADGAACSATRGPTCLPRAQRVNGTQQLLNPASCG